MIKCEGTEEKQNLQNEKTNATFCFDRLTHRARFRQEREETASMSRNEDNLSQ